MRRTLFAIAAAFALAGGARGDGPFEPFRPATPGPWVSLGAPTTPAGRAVLQPIAGVATARAQLDGAGNPVDTYASGTSSTASLTLFTEVGLHPRFAAGAQVVLVRNLRTASSGTVESGGFGDLSIFGRAGLWRETAWLPEATALVQVKLPTGRSESRDAARLGTDVFGSGTTDVTAGLSLTKGIRPVLLHGDVLATYAFAARSNGEQVQPGLHVAWSTAVEWPFAPGLLGLMVELGGRRQGDQRRGSAVQPGTHVRELLVGAGLQLLVTEDVQLQVGWQRTLSGANVAAIDAAVLTVVPTVTLWR